MSSPLGVGCRFWSSSTILLEPLQTCPGTALRAASAVWGTAQKMHCHFPIGYSRQGCHMWWAQGSGERKPNLFWRVLKRIGVVYLQPPLWADRSVISWAIDLLFSFGVSLLLPPNSHTDSPFSTLSFIVSFTMINKPREAKFCPHPCYAPNWVHWKA